MGKEQFICRHLIFINSPVFLFRQWGNANTGHLHVTGVDDPASPRERKAVGEWLNGGESEALWCMQTVLPLRNVSPVF